ncbi:DUF2207 domain-containing protein [Amnibacterium flavum]|uniref:DUF2207 domain-containing protein n=1 Tax=Amnibacterium flavum TaxID=2173173 RepID=UPI001404170D|nr:DUF2207 domain-containing protein [Amnibacterium flavum]
MRRNSLRILTVLVLAGAAALGAAQTAGAAAQSAPEGVDDFSFSSFDADYRLSRDDAGRSTLHTVETLTAVFPDIDQNHGIRRAIPLEFDGHPTDLEIISVTDENGAPRDYETDSDDGIELITIADDDFVRGEQTYVIEYEQRNVTRFYSDTDADEFMWDINGTEWAQPFGTVSATLFIPSDLASDLTGGLDCSWGAPGSGADCVIESASSDGGTVITASQTGLAAGENVTIAVGFKPGTFEPRDDSFWASGFAPVMIFGIVALIAAIIAAIVTRLGPAADAKGRPTIVAEYLPPEQPELPVLAVIIGKPRRAVAATLVSFAVRGIARIVDTDGGYALEYRGEGKPIRARAAAGLGAVERAIAVSFFGQVLTPGERADLSTPDTQVALSVSTALDKARIAAERDEYRNPVPKLPAAIVVVISFLAVCALFVSAVGLLVDSRGGALPVLAFLLAFVAVLPALFVFHHPLTAKGAEVRDHIRGLGRYLRLAEEDRLKILQSVEGATRVAEAADDGSAGGVVRLYERLLPYAVLLGVEKSWSQVLGDAYEREGGTPDWYRSTDGFSVAAFSAGIGSFSGSAASQYSGSVSSSSSGGSSGGSFSGGGGGGGGGGGV